MAPSPRQFEPPAINVGAFIMSANATGQDPPTADQTSPASPPSQPSISSPQQPSASPTSENSPAPSSSANSPPPAPPSSTSAPPPPPPPTTSSAQTSEPPPTPSSSPSSASPSPSSTPEPTSSAVPTTSQEPSSPTPTLDTTAVVTVTPTDAVTTVVLLTSTTTPAGNAAAPTISSAQATPTPIGASTSNQGSGGLDQKAKVAIGVVVPIAAIAIFAIVGLFWWKKRRARREAEEARRKEVEDYAYNPNADPTIPAVGLAADNSYEMREDGAGYRGWGGPTGRKASTTMSGGVTNPYSDMTSPTRGNMSEARSGDGLLDGSYPPEGEILGAMGPSAANNRGDVRRGPSNASSSYSAAGRSDGSDGGMGIPYGSAPYYDQFGQSPYDTGYGGPNGDVPVQPVIRDNPARRNTRIENPLHYPQQSAGISQNF